MPSKHRQGERASRKRELRSCKFRIHGNQVEVEYEGSETFAVERLLPAIERLTKAQLSVNTSSNPDRSAGASSTEAMPDQEGPHPTTREIGEKIGAEDWDDLALAACGHLTLARQLASYSQDQILEQMHLGPNCSESEMNRALSRILKDMVKRGNLEKKESGYVLSEKMRESLAQRLTWKDLSGLCNCSLDKEKARGNSCSHVRNRFNREENIVLLESAIAACPILKRSAHSNL